jgi:hypothetical protein
MKQSTLSTYFSHAGCSNRPDLLIVILSRIMRLIRIVSSRFSCLALCDVVPRLSALKPGSMDNSSTAKNKAPLITRRPLIFEVMSQIVRLFGCGRIRPAQQMS